MPRPAPARPGRARAAPGRCACVHAGPAVAERNGTGGHRAAAFAHAGVERALGARQRAHAVRAVDRVETLAEKQGGPGVVGGAVDIGQRRIGRGHLTHALRRPDLNAGRALGLVVPALQLGAQALEAGGIGQAQQRRGLAAAAAVLDAVERGGLHRAAVQRHGRLGALHGPFGKGQQPAVDFFGEIGRHGRDRGALDGFDVGNGQCRGVHDVFFTA
jgi:hypothetical protein